MYIFISWCLSHIKALTAFTHVFTDLFRSHRRSYAAFRNRPSTKNFKDDGDIHSLKLRSDR